MQKFTAAFACLVVALSASASPLSFSTTVKAVESRGYNAAQDVWNPTITEPTEGTVWKVGEVHTVSWDNFGIPEKDLDTPGIIYLGYLEDDSENLDIAHPIANKRFTYRDGSVNVTVPDVDTRDNYIVALLGDSGNISPKFTIQNPEGIKSGFPNIFKFIGKKQA